MFSNLRYFAALSLILVVLGASLLSFYFHEVRERELLDSTSLSAESTVNGYASAIWSRYAADVAANTNPAAVANFQNESRLFFSQQFMSKVTIFSLDVKGLYFSSINAYATDDGTTRITLFDLARAQAAQPVKRILKEVYFVNGISHGQSQVMVQLITPIYRTGSSTPDALAEVYIDVTGQWQKLTFLQYLILGTMIGIFTLLTLVLINTAHRAETIITKQHEVNLELTAAAAQAEAQSHDKSQFLASVSHELRTPLNAIIGFSEILRNEVKGNLQKIYQDYIDDIYASGRHLLSLINDILDYSKAEAGKLQIEWAETDATKIIRNSLRMVMPRAETAQVTLIEDIPSHHLVIVTDAKKLKQVLLNLLSNAVKFTPAGGEVRCQAWSDVATHSLVIVVQDSGIGIAPKDISKVMTPFGQVDSVLSRKYEGTGLGLPLSKKFVESMGGTFTITSELNEGTTVTISLPKAPPAWSTMAHSVTQPNPEESDVLPPREPVQ